uniref:Glutathione synthetase n=1 Tax=Takifugu rubripes TaxID=31033 RepID=A0A674NAA3_TAKRU
MAQGILKDTMANAMLVKDLAEVAKDTALLHGVQIRVHESPNSSEVVTYAPITLFPSPVPKSAFYQALAVQVHYNTLVDKISQDADFLQKALASTITVDNFTARLFKIHQQVLEEGKAQSIVLGLNRSDYMLDQKNEGCPTLKQIEINTFAASFAGLTSHTPHVHRLLLFLIKSNHHPDILVHGVGYGPVFSGHSERFTEDLSFCCRAIVMFLVEENQINIFDQRCIENELWKRNISTKRKRFRDVSKTGSLDPDRKLFVDGQEVAVVYFRNGYMPQNYQSEQDWQARLLMERSLAVKCPDIGTHLAGTKKVQQVLSQPGVLEKFFPEQPQVVEQIRSTFAGLYTLDMGPEGDKTIEMALRTPGLFVLKPQREGGGNNLYGAELQQVLQEVKGSEERMAYILMDKIHPTPVQNILLKRDAPLKISTCLCELGVFGTYVRKGREMVLNKCAGHLLRTKSSEHADGGVAAGVAVLDNPLLL